MKILKEVRFSESLLILLEIRFVWNNGAQKHSLSIDVRLPRIRRVFSLLYRIDVLAVYRYPDKIYFISITILKLRIYDVVVKCNSTQFRTEIFFTHLVACENIRFSSLFVA